MNNQTQAQEMTMKYNYDEMSAPIDGGHDHGPDFYTPANMDYKALYNDLKAACIDYHAAYEGSTLKAEAYETIVEHMSGRARDMMQEIAAEVEAEIAADLDNTNYFNSQAGQ